MLTLATSLRISLADVARLARVQRPVVSMWRSRGSATDTPFPSPVTTQRGVARFDAEEVVTWLETTGHGLNPDARADLATFAHPVGVPSRGDLSPAESSSTDEAHVRAVSALLCLKAIAGVQLTGLDRDHLLDLADDADPDDDLLHREVAALEADSTELTSYVDRLADAAYTPALAFEQLMGDRFRRGLDGHARTALREDGRRLVARIAQGLATAVDLQPPVFVDPTAGGSDLLVEIASAYAEGPAPTVMTSSADSDLARFVRRRLRVQDVHREPLVVDDDGAFAVSRPAVLVAQLPGPDEPQLSDVQILSAIDNIVVQMDERQWGAIIGPATTLTDASRSSEGDRIRDAVLRSGRVRAILRLPQGLMVSAPRQPLALWVLGPAHPDVPIGERWTVIGDLADATLTDAAIDDVVTDVVASLGDKELVRSHAFRFGRRVDTRSLLAGRGALVDTVIRSHRPAAPDGAALALRVAQLVRSLELADASGAPALQLEVLPPRDALTGTPTAALGRLLDVKALRLVRGHRISAEHLGADAGARVIGPDELTGRLTWGGRRIDHLVLGATYAVAQLTLPGDVVFCTSPHVAARVDLEGGSLVLAPARGLRSVPKPDVMLVPEALAADINAVPPSARSYRLWPVRLAPADQAAPLAAAMAAIEHERSAARDRLSRLDELATSLLDGVIALGVALVTLHPATSADRPPGPVDHQKSSDQTSSDQPRQEGR